MFVICCHKDTFHFLKCNFERKARRFGRNVTFFVIHWVALSGNRILVLSINVSRTLTASAAGHCVHHRAHGVKTLHQSNGALIQLKLQACCGAGNMEKGRSTPKLYGSLDQTELCGDTGKQGDETHLSLHAFMNVECFLVVYLTSVWRMHERCYFYFDAVLFNTVKSFRN